MVKTYLDQGRVVRAVRLGRSTEEQAEAVRFLTENGYPWLLGNPEIPWDMAPKGGTPGDPGIRLDEQWGEIVIHTGKISYRARCGDYIVLYQTGEVIPIPSAFFDKHFIEVT